MVQGLSASRASWLPTSISRFEFETEDSRYPICRGRRIFIHFAIEYSAMRPRQSIYSLQELSSLRIIEERGVAATNPAEERSSFLLIYEFYCVLEERFLPNSASSKEDVGEYRCGGQP